MPDQPTRQEVVNGSALRGATVLGSIGMVVVIIAILLLATARPQGVLEPLDDSQHRALLGAAESRLDGFEVRDDGSARLDIAYAMELVVERGVDLPLVAGGAPPDVAEAPVEPVDAEDVDDAVVAELPDGEPIFAAQCAACHQATGAGIPGAFPPLAGHVYELVAADRDLPPTILLYGLQGPITVHGMTYNGLMPPFAQLSDADIAAVLNHVLEAWGDADELGDAYTPYAADDVAALRDQGLSATDVHQLRQDLGLP